MKDHFLDKLSLIKNVSEIIELLDGYESVRTTKQRNREIKGDKQRSIFHERRPKIVFQPLYGTAAQRFSAAREKAF